MLRTKHCGWLTPQLTETGWCCGFHENVAPVDLASTDATAPARAREELIREQFVARSSTAHSLFDRGILTVGEYVQMLTSLHEHLLEVYA